MAYDNETVLRLIERLYAAAESPDAWPSFLDDLSDCLGSKMAALFHHDVRRRSASVAVLRRADPDFIRPYEEHYAARNPFFSPAAKIATGDVFDDTVIAEETLLRSDYYNEWMVPQDARYGAAIVAFSEAGALSVLSTWRGHAAPRITTGELELLRVLRPHVQRALQIHRALSAADERASLMGDSLDLVPLGVVVLDGGGKVIRMNRYADAWAKRGDAFVVLRGELRIVSADASAQLTRLVASALRASAGEGFGAGGALLVPLVGGRRPLHFVVAPLPARAGQRRDAVAILISGPPPDASLEGPVSALYGFTAAEARVVAELVSGSDVVAAAANLNVTPATIRTHLKRIFAKTGTFRQAELVALLTPLISVPMRSDASRED